jgi:hypothetical protein
MSSGVKIVAVDWSGVEGEGITDRDDETTTARGFCHCRGRLSGYSQSRPTRVQLEHTGRDS